LVLISGQSFSLHKLSLLGGHRHLLITNLEFLHVIHSSFQKLFKVDHVILKKGANKCIEYSFLLIVERLLEFLFRNVFFILVPHDEIRGELSCHAIDTHQELWVL
jgi:hypothetical protein